MPAILYARYSPRPDAVADTETNAAQLAAMREYCDKQGYRIKAEKQDEEVSGGGNGKALDPADELIGRVGLWEAVGMIRKGDVLVVYKRDRLARSVYASEYLRRLVGSRKGRIESLQGLNGDTMEERLVQQVLAATDEFYKRLTSARTSDAMKRHQAAGRSMSSKPPYGKQIDPADPSRLITAENETLALRKIMGWHRAGIGVHAITVELNSIGAPCRGKMWHASTVRRIIGRATAPGTPAAGSGEPS